MLRSCKRANATPKQEKKIAILATQDYVNKNNLKVTVEAIELNKTELSQLLNGDLEIMIGEESKIDVLDSDFLE